MLELVAALLAMVTTAGPVVRARVEAAAPLILEEAEAAGLNPLVLGALVYRESAFNPRARGARGERGLAQIHPRGLGRTVCRDLMPRIWDPRTNLRCAARLLVRARERCGPDPARFLIKYNAPARRCGRSNYAKRVLSAINTKGEQKR